METQPAQSGVLQAAKFAQYLRQRLNQVIIGQPQVVDEVLTAFLSGGHVLLEGVPGVGKTLMVRALAQSFAGQFCRIQFTPDLMPADVTGHYRFDVQQNAFVLRKGPVFTHLLLADEINRAPAKTQAALLEVMQERAVTLDGKTHELAQPFMVLATQNPIEQEGTYPLPEAQLDRFMFKILIDYPKETDEVALVNAVISSENNDILQSHPPQHVFQATQIMQLQKLVRQVAVDKTLVAYAVRLVAASRQHSSLAAGAGPRAGIMLITGARAWALLQQRDFVIPDDIKTVFLPTMRHRVSLAIQAEMDGIQLDGVLTSILQTVAAPR